MDLLNDFKVKYNDLAFLLSSVSKIYIFHPDLLTIVIIIQYMFWYNVRFYM